MHTRSWRLRSRIASAYIALMVLVITLLSLALFSLLQRTYMERLEEEVVGQIQLAQLVLPAPPPGGTAAPALQAAVNEIQQRLNARITVFDAHGVVLADSLQPSTRGTVDPQRPEIAAAIQGLRGANARQSVATGDERLYIAVPFNEPGQPGRIVRIGIPLTTIAAARQNLALTVLGIAVGAALIALLLALLIARRVTQPLLELRTMAGSLAGGDLSVQVPVPPEEEVAALARDFNQMAHRLRELMSSRERERQRLATILTTMADGILILDRNENVTLANQAATQLLPQLQHLPYPLARLPIAPHVRPHFPQLAATEPLVLDVVPLSTPARSLRALITHLPPPDHEDILIVFQDFTDLRRAEAIRRAFLTNISHDLRTPLTSIQIMLDALEDGALDDRPAAEDFVRRMQEETASLKHLMHDFLELSRMESGQMTFEYKHVDLVPFVSSLLDRMRLQAHHHRITLCSEVPPVLPPVLIDPTRIEQVILNLLQNALKFTLEGGTITLRARPHAEGVLVEVQDSGQGIAPADLPHIFERFYKGDRARQGEGTGLGLSIAKHIIERHGGQIWATSTLNQGTTIAFTLASSPP